MISRYEVKDVSDIWSPFNRYKKFLEVETALLKALEEEQIIPEGTSRSYQNVEIRPERIDELEAITRHDIIAFTTSITEQVSPQIARFFHFGATSSDILDTALSLQLRDSLHVVIQDIETLLQELQNKVHETDELLAMGRSHGMYAEPMVFAQKFLMSYEEIRLRLQDYKRAVDEELSGIFSGAVGNYTILSPAVEAKALDILRLKAEKVSSQIIPRHHIAKIISIGSQLAAGLERLSVELRLLQHSDVAEVQESFSAGQKGSSTMPHKRNPISSENITGLSRMIRSHMDIALENCVLWHERDISHSCTERMYLPDHFGLLSYALRRMASTVKNLVINREHIESKVLKGHAVLSSFTLHQMILLNNVTREELYAIVQKASFESSSAEEFYAKITKVASGRNLKVPEFLNGQKLKGHYVKQFKMIKERVLTT